MSINEQEVTIEWKHFGEAFVGDLWQFFNSDKYSDITIITEDGHEVKSHRILLAMCSQFFRDVFQRNNSPGHIVCLSHIHSDIVMKIFGLIYGGSTCVPTKDLDAFLKAAKFLKLHGFEEVSYDVNNLGGGIQQDHHQRSFSLTLRRIDSPDIGLNVAANTGNGETTEMNSQVSSTHSAAQSDEALSMQANEKFFPSDDSDECDSDN